MAVYKTEALVLRSRKLNEADNLITLFSREHGKIKTAAKGVRKTKSHKRSGVQPFTHGVFLLYQGRTLDHITQCESKSTFPGLLADLDLFAYASYLAELVDGFTVEHQPQEELFVLFLTVLHLLEHSDPELLSRAFEIRLANLVGYQPQLSACVNCGRAMPFQPIRFSASMGGVLCPACAGQDEFASRCSPGTIGALQQLQRMELTRLSILRLSPEIREELSKMLRVFLGYRLEKKIKAWDFLQALNDSERKNEPWNKEGSEGTAEGKDKV
ncbi:MAG TPA: DNA repair protein RecO [Bacillota bacterium]|nr:DNA repair protein RecO [Bacillota bacterium]